MKSISKTALATVLALGVVAGPPALAQKKKDDKAANAQPKLKLGKEALAAQVQVQQGFQTAVPVSQALTAAINAKRAAQAARDTAGIAAADAQIATQKTALIAALNGLEPQIAALEAVAKTNDELYVAQSVRYTKESAMVQANNAGVANPPATANAHLAPMLDKLLANPSTPQGAIGGYAYDRAWIASNQRQYAQAASFFERAQAAGYNNPDLRIQIARTKMDGGDLAGGLAALSSEIDALKQAGKPVPSDYYTLAINRLYTAKNPDAIVWTQRWLRDYPTQKNWHDAIMTFGFAGKNPRNISDLERLDLYRLLDTSGALADETEYFLYADAALKAGVPYETQSVLKTGVAKGKLKTTATNYIDLSAGAQKAIREDTPLAQLDARARSAPNGELALQTGDGYLGQGNNAKAVELYKVAQSKGVKDTDGLMTRLGIAQLRSGDQAGAKASFQAVGGTRKDVAALWLTYLERPTTGAAATGS